MKREKRKKERGEKEELSRTYVRTYVWEGREELRRKEEGRNVKRAVKGGEKNGRRGRAGGREGEEKETRLTRAHSQDLSATYRDVSQDHTEF